MALPNPVSIHGSPHLLLEQLGVRSSELDMMAALGALRRELSRMDDHGVQNLAHRFAEFIAKRQHISDRNQIGTIYVDALENLNKLREEERESLRQRPA
ncbi:MAG TPA: hypothetical protein VMA75_04115 [Candidatus Paceibacterota bacterium]|nr:hypothetical protein [Candidatus Paceibacterota bacterium]